MDADKELNLKKGFTKENEFRIIFKSFKTRNFYV